MCAACVAQGVVYVGGALGGLQVMAARARARRSKAETGARGPEAEPETSDGQGEALAI